jgi:hypothetical protein
MNVSRLVGIHGAGFLFATTALDDDALAQTMPAVATSSDGIHWV